MWTSIMVTPKKDIKEKVSWYEKQKKQKELGEWVEEVEDGNVKV